MSGFPEWLLDLAFFKDLEACVNDLATMAEPEDWDYRFNNSDHNKPVLFNYLAHTYSRLCEQEKVMPSDNAQFLRFNTGLVTPNREEIFALFSVNRVPDKQPWYFDGWNKKSNNDLNKFQSLPSIATYFDDPSCLVLDNRKEIRVNVDHIINENKFRFPAPFCDISDFQLQTILTGAVENAKRRAARNYKTAIPQYYKGRVQLLLPLCLTNPARADLALVIEDFSGFCRAATCLTLDMAYNNARQLARPDKDWLQP